MVKYYGRARQRTGSVNRNQPGLKQAGCVTGRGRPSWVSRYITRRVNCNARVGCVTAAGTLNGQLRVMQEVFNLLLELLVPEDALEVST